MNGLQNKEQVNRLTDSVKKLKDNRIVSFLAPIIMLVAVCLVFAVMTKGRFMMPVNLKMIMNSALPLAIVATGGVLIYSSGNMNIAMGGSTAIACIVGGMVYNATGSVPMMLLACIATGVAIMALCLVLNQIFKLGIIVITIIMMTMLSSLQEWLVGGKPISLPYGEMSAVAKMQIPLILGIVFFLVCLFIFDFTKMGRTFKFIGDNATCARQTGINATKILTFAFLVSGVAIGLGAFATNVAYPSISKETCISLNMNVILAIVVAGTPMNGGTRSKVYSGIVGAILIEVLNNGLLMVGVDSIYIQAIKGVLFLLIVFLSAKRPNVLPVKDMI